MTKKTLIGKILMKLVKLEFQSDNIIKSKARKINEYGRLILLHVKTMDTYCAKKQVDQNSIKKYFINLSYFILIIFQIISLKLIKSAKNFF